MLVQYLMVKFCTAMQKIHNSPIFVLAEKQNNKNKQTNTLKTIITPNPLWVSRNTGQP